MKIRLLLTCTLTFTGMRLQSQQSQNTAYARFIENKGQWNNNVSHMAKLNGGELWVEKDGMLFNFMHHKSLEKIEHARHGHIALNGSEEIRQHAYKMKFIHTSQAQVSGNAAEKDYANYYLGNDPAKWVSRAGISKEIYVSNAVKGIDYRFYTRSGNLKYDVLVHPGANLNDLYIQYEGVERLFLKNGDLHIVLSTGEVVEKAPIAYQGEKNNTVDVRFKLVGNSVFFETGAYDKSVDLVIDPTLVFSTYTGALGDNWGYTATYDNSGNLYSGSIAFGAYPTTVGAYSTAYSGVSVTAAITKFNST
ncbi:MAG TPA: hypothetical protein VD905_12735, partial [Flavobacteriales bacterium]|nr:hypothetical protein [Flavobacteriales bacterium]